MAAVCLHNPRLFLVPVVSQCSKPDEFSLDIFLPKAETRAMVIGMTLTFSESTRGLRPRVQPDAARPRAPSQKGQAENFYLNRA
jgi:hypothetical protein